MSVKIIFINIPRQQVFFNGFEIGILSSKPWKQGLLKSDTKLGIYACYGQVKTKEGLRKQRADLPK